jgi:acetyl esterase
MTVAETREAMRAAVQNQQDREKFRNEANFGVRMRRYGEDGEAVLVFFHGGRYFSGDLDTHDAICGLLAAGSGCQVAAVDYRLAPEDPFPAAYEDALRAVAWAQERFARVAVCGDSAGGGLAAAVAATPGVGPLALQVLIYPMLDAVCGEASYSEFADGPWPNGGDMRRGWDLYLAGGEDRRDPRISAAYAELHAGVAPAFLFTAGVDPLRDEGLAYGRRLEAAGVAVERLHFADMPHGFFTQPAYARTRELVAALGARLTALAGA